MSGEILLKMDYKENCDFSKKYNFELTKKGNSKNWIKIAKECSKDFKSTLLLPPPNITGKLHLGHALDSLTQDFIVRYSFLNENPIFWITGIDHAGISAQNKIESLNFHWLTDDDKKKSYALENWYPENRRNFYEQWENLGLMMDYESARFTLDESSQKEVKKAFVKLYKDGLIEKGLRLVNWDRKLRSVISDIEVVYVNSISKLYYIKYQLENSDEFLVAATSRPETIFADAALFINPKDKRYKNFLGKKAINPSNGIVIPILADESVKIDFGSGVLKCTPAHDFNDYKLGKKHGLLIESCCDEKGTLNSLAGKWKGFKLWEIRDDFTKDLISDKICIKVEEYENNVATSSKTGVIIEPLLSEQWFLDLPTLIIRVEKKIPNFLSLIEFIPKKFNNVIRRWVNESQKWCISRQLWWGHQIPVWYNKKTKEIHVDENPPINEHEWEQEKFVLDTWFSSSLWPLISVEKEIFLQKNYYPIATLVTGYDIVFFWVLKMVLLCSYLNNIPPFKKVFFHGLIRDKEGKKMSKSLGNGINPDELIKKYGTDSLRIFLLKNNIWGSDLIYEEEKLIGSWRFCQKVWSIASLIKKNIPEREIRIINEEEISDLQELENHWMINNLIDWQKRVDRFLKNSKWEISSFVDDLIKLVKEKLSGSYLELLKAKKQWSRENERVVIFTYHNILVYLHPVLPFLTEFIYQNLFSKNLLDYRIKKFTKLKKKQNEGALIDLVITLNSSIKNIRKNFEVDEFFLELNSNWRKKFFNFIPHVNQFSNFLTKTTIFLVNDSSDKVDKVFFDLNPFGIVWYREEIDKEKLKVNLDFYEKECERSQSLLNNKNFMEKAPAHLIKKEKEKFLHYKDKREMIEKKIRNSFSK